jgi:hypothetical protein
MGFTAANIACIKIKLDLIIAGTKLHGGVVMVLVHILVYVLDGLDEDNGLNIDVTTIVPDEILAMTDNSLVINLLSPNDI